MCKKGTLLMFCVCMSLCNDDIVLVIEDVNVTAQTNTNQLSSSIDITGGTTHVKRSYIEALPATGGGITQILRLNPAIKYNATQRTSTNAAEIDPDDISINGAPSWQNSFLLDGVNFNNDLNPRQSRISALNTKSQFSPNATLPDIGSISQGINLDSELLESISVHDSFVGAKYGGFEGGVVEAKTRDPRKGFHGKISTKYTSDTYLKTYIDDQLLSEYKSSTNPKLQSEFTKRIYNLTLEGHLSDDFGLIFSTSQTRSQFLKVNLGGRSAYFPANGEPQYNKQVRRSDNYLLKGIWYASDRVKVTPSFLYTPAHSTHANTFSKNGDFDIKTDGIIGSVGVDYEGDSFEFKNILSYSRLISSKDASSQNYITWPTTNHHNWGGTYSAEGAYGDIDQIQQTYSYKGELNFDPISAFGANHTFSMGVELAHKTGKYRIPGFFTAGTAFLKPLSAGQSCRAGDKLCIDNITSSANGIPTSRFSSTHGGFFHKYTKYQGKAKASINETSAWAQDEMQIGRLTTRIGARIDSESYYNQTTFSPRFSATYDVFGDEKTKINFGANRYHGRNVFAYALRNAMNSLSHTCERPTSYDGSDFVCKSNDDLPRYAKSNLKTPYNDELAFGLKQRIYNIDATLKFIKRYGRKEVRTKSYFNMQNLSPDYNPKYNTYYFEYNNSGKSRSDIYEIKLASLNDFELYGRHAFELSFNYINTKRNYNTQDNYLERDIYDVGVNGATNDTDKVIYNGDMIDRNSLPSADFNEPWEIKLLTMHKFSPINLGFTKIKTNLSNFFSYRGKHESIVRVGITKLDGHDYATYENINFGRAFNWDAKLGFEFGAAKNSAFFVNLEAYNVLNRRVIAGKFIDGVGKNTKTYTVYEPGRQLWFEVGYKW
ncbi:TonB-dependent receptor plug domain-containing protein [Campylobacter majalis]|uniref:TonB-dependent receptor plug domain-containing protein n=1 Tax=Campylobacter majalis TaxID=2790656 RepID=UPI003D6896BE